MLWSPGSDKGSSGYKTGKQWEAEENFLDVIFKLLLYLTIFYVCLCTRDLAFILGPHKDYTSNKIVKTLLVSPFVFLQE